MPAARELAPHTVVFRSALDVAMDDPVARSQARLVRNILTNSGELSSSGGPTHEGTCHSLSERWDHAQDGSPRFVGATRVPT